MKQFITSLLILCLATGNLLAQEIKGKVSDKEGKPLPYATIKAIALPDSATIVGGVTKEDGTFALSIGDHKLPILLQANLIGYSTEQVLCKDLMEYTLTLSESTTMLEEVAITANRVSHRLVAGGLSTQIDGSPLSKLTDIYSVLRGIPLVEVENDKVKVTGKGTPVIYINDRLMTSPNQLRELKPYLIKDIQVITNPGARYSSSVGAVIKIYTRREPGTGLSGEVMSFLQKAKDRKPGGCGYLSLNYRIKEWDIFATGWYNAWKDIDINPELSFHGKMPNSEWHNTTSDIGQFNEDTYNINIGTNYEDEHQSAGLRYQLQIQKSSKLIRSQLISQLEQNSPTTYNNETSGFTPWTQQHHPSLYYIRRWENWSAQVDMDYFQSSLSTNYTTTIERNETTQQSKTITSQSGDKFQSAGIRTDINGVVWGGRLNFGGAFTWVNNKFFSINDKINQEYTLPDLESQQREDTYALYLEYGHSLGEKVMLTAGARLEHLVNQYFDQKNMMYPEKRVSTNLFPTLSLSTELGGINTQLSFRSRISRPSYWQLQSEYQYLSKFEYQVGDPNLKPEINYTTQLLLNKKWVTLMLSHQYNIDALTQDSQPLYDPKKPGEMVPYVTLIKNINTTPYHLLRASVILSPRIKWWQPNLSLKFSKILGYQLQFFDQKITNFKPTLSIRLNNQFSLPKEITLSANFTYNLMGWDNNIELIAPMFYGWVQISKQWLKDKSLTTSLSINNFNTPIKARIVTPYTELKSHQLSVSRIKLTIAYRFNATKQKYQGKGALGSVINRM